MALSLLCGPAGCGDQAPAEPPPTAQAPSEATPSPATPSRWRFRPTLDANLPEGAVAEPVLELSEPRQRTVVVLAAVLRPGAPHVELERWTYEQIPNKEEGLRVLEEGQPAVRLRPGPRSELLGDLRRRLAAPRVVVTRPVGLTPTPAELIPRLAEALATMADSAASPRDRVVATATAVQGLDDAIVLEREALGPLSAALVPAPASEALTVEQESSRRATVSFDKDGSTVSLGLQRKSEGWAVVSAKLPSAAPPTPASP